MSIQDRARVRFNARTFCSALVALAISQSSLPQAGVWGLKVGLEGSEENIESLKEESERLRAKLHPELYQSGGIFREQADLWVDQVRVFVDARKSPSEPIKDSLDLLMPQLQKIDALSDLAAMAAVLKHQQQHAHAKLEASITLLAGHCTGDPCNALTKSVDRKLTHFVELGFRYLSLGLANSRAEFETEIALAEKVLHIFHAAEKYIAIRAELKEQMEDLENEENVRLKRIQELQTRRGDVHIKEVEQAKSKNIQTLESQTMVAALDQARKKLNLKNKEVQELKTQMKGHEQELEELANKERNTRDQIDKLKAELTAFQNQREELMSKQGLKRGAMEALQTEIKELETKGDILEKEANSKGKNIQELRADIEGLQKNWHDLKEEEDGLQMEMKELPQQRKLEGLEIELANAVEKMKTTSRENQILETAPGRQSERGVGEHTVAESTGNPERSEIKRGESELHERRSSEPQLHPDSAPGPLPEKEEKSKKESEKREEESEKRECPICLEELSGPCALKGCGSCHKHGKCGVHKTPCGHRFHMHLNSCAVAPSSNFLFENKDTTYSVDVRHSEEADSPVQLRICAVTVRTENQVHHLKDGFTGEGAKDFRCHVKEAQGPPEISEFEVILNPEAHPEDKQIQLTGCVPTNKKSEVSPDNLTLGPDEVLKIEEGETEKENKYTEYYRKTQEGKKTGRAQSIWHDARVTWQVTQYTYKDNEKNGSFINITKMAPGYWTVTEKRFDNGKIQGKMTKTAFRYKDLPSVEMETEYDKDEPMGYGWSKYGKEPRLHTMYTKQPGGSNSNFVLVEPEEDDGELLYWYRPEGIWDRSEDNALRLDKLRLVEPGPVSLGRSLFQIFRSLKAGDPIEKIVAELLPHDQTQQGHLQPILEHLFSPGTLAKVQFEKKYATHEGGRVENFVDVEGMLENVDKTFRSAIKDAGNCNDADHARQSQSDPGMVGLRILTIMGEKGCPTLGFERFQKEYPPDDGLRKDLLDMFQTGQKNLMQDILKELYESEPKFGEQIKQLKLEQSKLLLRHLEQIEALEGGPPPSLKLLERGRKWLRGEIQNNKASQLASEEQAQQLRIDQVLSEKAPAVRKAIIPLVNIDKEEYQRIKGQLEVIKDLRKEVLNGATAPWQRELALKVGLIHVSDLRGDRGKLDLALDDHIEKLHVLLEQLDDTCAICMRTNHHADCARLGKGQAAACNCGIKTDCGHRFHRECLHTWLLAKNKCPICRREPSAEGIPLIEILSRNEHS